MPVSSHNLPGFDKFLEHPAVSGSLMLVMCIYAAHTIPKISGSPAKVLHHPVFQVLFWALICYKASHNTYWSIAIPVCLLLVYQGVKSHNALNTPHGNSKNNTVRKVKGHTAGGIGKDAADGVDDIVDGGDDLVDGGVSAIDWGSHSITDLGRAIYNGGVRSVKWGAGELEDLGRVTYNGGARGVKWGAGELEDLGRVTYNGGARGLDLGARGVENLGRATYNGGARVVDWGVEGVEDLGQATYNGGARTVSKLGSWM
jgi:hypothetical protein